MTKSEVRVTRASAAAPHEASILIHWGTLCRGVLSEFFHPKLLHGLTTFQLNFVITFWIKNPINITYTCVCIFVCYIVSLPRLYIMCYLVFEYQFLLRISVFSGNKCISFYLSFFTFTLK